MPSVDLIDAIEHAVDYWPWLFVVVFAQVLHELTHFAVARLLGVQAWIQLSLTNRMSVIYPKSWEEWFWASHGRRMPVDLTRTPTRQVTTLVDGCIGIAPTLAGSLAGLVWVAVIGWPTMSPVVAVLGFAWLLYTRPSSDDVSAIADWIRPTGGWNPLQRSVLIGFGTIVFGVCVGWILPWTHPLVTLTVQAFAVAGVAYLGLSVWEHEGIMQHADPRT